MNPELKKAREKAGYSIEDVSNILKIRKQYLIALENGRYKDMPAKIYIEGYTKMYCKLLGIDTQDKKININPTKKTKIPFYFKEKFIACISVFMLVFVIITYVFLYPKLFRG